MPGNPSRRFMTNVVALAGKPWNAVALQVENLIKKLMEAQQKGIPGGWFKATPPDVQIGGTASAGNGDVAGWVSADAVYVVPTGTPSGLANANTEGVSISSPRLDHQHKRDVRVYFEGVEVATRNALDIIGGAVTDDAGNDRVTIEVGTIADPFARVLGFYGN